MGRSTNIPVDTNGVTKKGGNNMGTPEVYVASSSGPKTLICVTGPSTSAIFFLGDEATPEGSSLKET